LPEGFDVEVRLGGIACQLASFFNQATLKNGKKKTQWTGILFDPGTK
jgi:hypothetical protein